MDVNNNIWSIADINSFTIIFVFLSCLGFVFKCPITFLFAKNERE